MDPLKELLDIATASSLHPLGSDFYAHMDRIDELAEFRQEFVFPDPPHPIEGEDGDRGVRSVIYLCGNSLGIQPKEPIPWLTMDDVVAESMAAVVGALPKEVVMMNTLTGNLHLMLAAFYAPTAVRHMILVEKKAFPSDMHVVQSQIFHHGFIPSTSLLEVGPRDGEDVIRMEDIYSILHTYGPQIALILMGGVHYYTGQLLDMQEITVRGRAEGCVVGFDLAHVVGNVPVSLHDWDVDFACWCSYKYLNCGPGSIGGCFVHERYGGGKVLSGGGEDVERVEVGFEYKPLVASVASLPSPPELPSTGTVSTEETNSTASLAPLTPARLCGWWGHRVQDRFEMAPRFVAESGANGFRLSNPSPLLIACARASLDLFDKATMPRLRKKSLLLTTYLEYLLVEMNKEIEQQTGATALRIFTPSDPYQRGCQLSISFTGFSIDAVHESLQHAGVICDVRRPDVMRVAPAPLYNSFADTWLFVEALRHVLLQQAVPAIST